MVTSSLQQMIQTGMEVASVPGIALSVIEDHQIIETQVFGVKDVETREPVTTDTVFQAASLSKPIFTYAVLSLVQEGNFDLDRPLHEYLPLPEVDEISQFKQITARQALTHTTGLQNWRFNMEDKFEFAFEPGKGFSYSGEGYFYVQCVIEHITGQSLEAFVQERVLRPMRMNHSTYIWRAELEPLMSMGHHNRGKKSEPWNMWQGHKLLEVAAQHDKPLDDWMVQDYYDALPQVHADLTPLPNNILPNAAGSLLTSAPEYARFMLHLLDAKDRFAREMLTSHRRVKGPLSWGLGIGLEEVNGGTYFWHWGDNGKFKNFMFGSPVSGNGIVILTNEDRGLDLCRRIAQEVYGHDLYSFLWI